MNRRKGFYTTGTLFLVLLVLLYGGWRAYLAPDETLRENLKQELGADFFLLETSRNSVTSESPLPETPEGSPVTHAEVTETAAPASPPSAAPTLESITDRYRQRLEHLEQTVVGRLEMLTEKAVAEHTEQRKLGTDSKSALARKYIQAVQMMEEAVDHHFNLILAEMEAELTTHQYPTEILRELEDHYQQQRNKQRAVMMEQAKLFM